MISIVKMANWRDEVLLEGDFSIPPKRRVPFRVTLIPVGLFYSQLSTSNSQYEEKCLLTTDITGCLCGPSAPLTPTRQPDSQPSVAASFTVYAYPFRKKLFSGKKTRHRVAVTFEINSHSTLEENKNLAQQWKNVINCLARGLHIEQSGN
jgi:hypothetical protein